MKAALLAINSQLNTDVQLTEKRILQQMDNTTAVAYINQQGGSRSINFTQIALDIWTLCQPKKITLVAQHLPGAQNLIADTEFGQNKRQDGVNTRQAAVP